MSYGVTHVSGSTVSKILYLRQQYHFGPGKIADYLRRFHGRSMARSSVHQLLVKHGLNRLPANQKYRPHRKRWQRYEKPQPGHSSAPDAELPNLRPHARDRSAPLGFMVGTQRRGPRLEQTL